MKRGFNRKLLSVMLCLAMLISMIPLLLGADFESDADGGGTGAVGGCGGEPVIDNGNVADAGGSTNTDGESEGSGSTDTGVNGDTGSSGYDGEGDAEPENTGTDDGIKVGHNGTLENYDNESSGVYEPLVKGLTGSVDGIKDIEITGLIEVGLMSEPLIQLNWGNPGSVMPRDYDGTTVVDLSNGYTAPTLDGAIFPDDVNVQINGIRFDNANAGSRSIVASSWNLTGNDAYKYIAPVGQPPFNPVEINRANLWAGALNFAPVSTGYTGTPRSVTIPSTAILGGTGTISIFYTGTGATSYTRSTTAPTNTGTYDIHVTISGWDNFFDASDFLLGTFTILKHNITLVADSFTMMLEGNRPEPLTFHVTNMLQGFNAADILNDDVTLTYSDTFDIYTAGTYPIIISGGTLKSDAAANFNISQRVNGSIQVISPDAGFTSPDPGVLDDLENDLPLTLNGNFNHLQTLSVNNNNLILGAVVEKPGGGSMRFISGWPGFDGEIGEIHSGSTIVIFYSDFLKSLPPGEYLVLLRYGADIVSIYDSPSTTFIIPGETENGEGINNVSSTASSAGGDADASGRRVLNTRTPQTGDYSDNSALVILIIVSVLGIGMALGWRQYSKKAGSW
ncbi:MAG: YDG domain-containing protein [Oscillospiraceae bacterium]|nr:YDG domain-containing protein [Oscillospiraceae bacterium]